MAGPCEVTPEVTAPEIKAVDLHPKSPRSYVIPARSHTE